MIPPGEKIIEIKKCLLSGQEFFVTDKDLEFYDKVSPIFGGKKYTIPSPTLCPDERMRRRLAWRNERKLYKRKCDKTGKEIISIYSPDKPYLVYDQKVWWSDEWIPADYGTKFDFERGFFEQLKKLFQICPIPSGHRINADNCDYAVHIADSKNIYLGASVVGCEEMYYGSFCSASKGCVDYLRIHDSENCYSVTDITNCHSVYFSQDCENCSFCYFCYDCTQCNNCFMCSGLKNKIHCINNIQHTSESFEIEKNKLLGEKYAQKLNQYFQNLKNQSQHKYMHGNGISNTLCTGDYLNNTENTFYSFDIIDGSDNKYCVSARKTFNCEDAYSPYTSTYCYEIVSGLQTDNLLFSAGTWGTDNTFYSILCQNIHNSFGNISLKKGYNCILNKPYSVSEYETLCGKIIDHMISTGEWGEFFPHELSPFGYNETVAQEYFPMTEEEVKNMPQFHEWRGSSFRASETQAVRDTESRTITTQSVQNLSPTYGDNIPGSRFPSEGRARGWNWYTEETKKFEGTGVQPLPIQEYDEKIVGFETAQKNIDTLLSGVVKCEVTGKPYKIIRQELAFYIENGIPIPTKHPDQRHKERMALRNPRKLYERQCMCEQCEQIAKETHTFQEENFVFFPLLSGEGQRVRSRKIITTYPPVGAQQFVSNSNPKVVCEECYRKLVY